MLKTSDKMTTMQRRKSTCSDKNGQIGRIRRRHFTRWQHLSQIKEGPNSYLL